jgi:hypothetical protein
MIAVDPSRKSNEVGMKNRNQLTNSTFSLCGRFMVLRARCRLQASTYHKQ